MSSRRRDLADHHNGSFDRLFREYVDRLNRGEGLDKEEIRARHRDIAGRLIHDLESYESFGGRLESEAPLGTLGDYTLRRQIGRGGMGVVYDAWQNSMDRRVALKVLPAGIAADRHACARFMREAQTAGHLGHPNVVPVHAMGVDENTPYYAMEYVDGETLAQIIARLKHLEPEAQTVFGHKDGAGYFENLARAFDDVADGLQHAHSRRVIHRDIKPSNLILDTEGHLRILDFGLAHLEGHESLTASGDVVGTPLYMSPEQARKRKIPVDHRTDVYSLGATMYEMLTMRPPFRGKDNADTLSQIIEREPTPPRKVNPRVPRDLETIALKCLRKVAGDRYRTAEAVAQDLRRFVRGDPIEARPQGRWEQLLARVKRHRTKLLVAAAFLVLLLGATALKLERDYARSRAELAEYESRVLDVLTRIYKREFSLKTVVGRAQHVFGRLRTEFTLQPVVPDDFKALGASGETDPVLGAVAALKAVADAPPERPDAHYHLAKAYRLLDRLEEARTELRRALGCDPDFVPAKVLELELAGLDEKSPEYAAISREYGETGDWRQWWLEAQRRMKEESWTDAATAYGELIALREDRKEPYIGSAIEAHIGRGVARLETRNYPGAHEDFQAALILAPGFVETALLRGKAYYLLGRSRHVDDWTRRAEEIFEGLHAEARLEEKDDVALWIAAVYDSLGDYCMALDWAQKLGDADPAERLRAYFHHRRGHLDEELDEAIEAGRRAILRNDEDLIAHLVLASAFLKDLWSGPDPERPGKLAELLRVSQRATQLDRENVLALCLRAGAEAERNYGAYLYLKEQAMKTKLLGTLLPILFVWLRGPGQAQEGFFDPPTIVENVNTPGDEWSVDISADDRELYFASYDGVEYNLFVSTRESVDDPFGPPRNLVEVNSGSSDLGPSISHDGHELYFSSSRLGCYKLYVARREDKNQPFGGVTPLSGLNEHPDLACPLGGTVRGIGPPEISADGRELFFAYGASGGGGDLYLATRLSEDDEFVDFRPLDEINDPLVDEMAPKISTDGLTLFWSDFHGSPRDGGHGHNDIWMATRPAVGERFGEVRNVGPPVCGPLREEACSISSDWPASGSKLYFARGSGHGDIYQATWHLDCNGNGVDDSEDIESGDAQDTNANEIPDECEPELIALFRRGDSNDDGSVDIADATYTLNWLFAGGPEPGCLAAANMNGDDRIDIGDPVSTLTFLFGGGAAPSAPYPDCGPGTSEADMKLGCETPPSSCAVVP